MEKQNQAIIADVYDIEKNLAEICDEDLVTIERRNYYRKTWWAQEQGIYNSIGGKHFSIGKKKDLKTIIYRLYLAVDSKRNRSYYEYEPLLYADSIDNEREIQVFFIDDPAPTEDLILFHFYPDMGEVYINLGRLTNDRIKVSKKLVPIRLTRLKKNQVHYMSYSDDGSNSHETGRWYDASDDAFTIVIDPISLETVKREYYYDENNGIGKYRIWIENNKSYFTFQIRFDGGSLYHELTNLEIGRFYRRGYYGYQKNYILAWEYAAICHQTLVNTAFARGRASDLDHI